MLTAPVVLSAFGPYVYPGITTAQLVIYPLTLFAIIVAIGRRTRIYPEAVVIAFTLATIVLVAIAGTFQSSVNTSPWTSANAAATTDNLLLPICAALLVGALAAMSPNRGRPLQVVAATTVAAMGANTLVAGLQFLGIARATIGSVFWGTGDTGERSLTVGRFTGVFSQPSLAGFAYTLGCLSAVYALRRRPVLQGFIVGILMMGGVLTASKEFLLIGLPVTVVLFWLISGRRIILLGIAFIASIPLLTGILARWRGFERLFALLPGTPGWLQTVTGNRYGANSSTQPVIDAVLRDHPLMGYGLSALNTPMDTTYVYILVVSGFIGLIAIIVAMIAIIVAWWNRRKSLVRPDRLYLAAVVISLTASTLGANALNGNRVAIVAWSLVAVMLVQPPSGGHGVSDGSAGRGGKRPTSNLPT